MFYREARGTRTPGEHSSHSRDIRPVKLLGMVILEKAPLVVRRFSNQARSSPGSSMRPRTDSACVR